MDFAGDLDRFLADVGEDMILRRKVNGNFVSVTFRGKEKVVKRPDNLASGMSQDVKQVVMSMTEIRAASWPGTGVTGTAPFQVDTAIPTKDDDVIIQGKRFRVDSADPKSIDGVVFRVNLLIKGNAAGA